MIAGILLAAGSSGRFGKNKLLEMLGAKTVIERSYENMKKSECFDYIVVVCKDEERSTYAAMFEDAMFVCGGKERRDSVFCALKSLKPGTKIVAIHDGARCFASPELFRECVESAQAYGSGVAGHMCVDTLKYASEGMITSTLDRSLVAQVQTPQVFDAELITSAYEKVVREEIFCTDDASVLELTGRQVRLVQTRVDNLKITYEEDIAKARGMIAPRIGHGYDVHAFASDRQLILGGVNIPHDAGLLGHSDADVLVHAIMDAMLGAAALGDIGRHFPDTDEKYRGISSLELLAHTAKLIGQKGYCVSNIDSTLVLQKPKVATYIPNMRKNIAEVLGVDDSCINVKATTTEKLGFEGRSEGVSAHAVCILI